jgi:hypothetical protein
MAKIEQPQEQRPYRGMQTFSEEHKNLFFGRTKAVDDIFGLLKNNSLTVIFGKSGIGKSSVINAGLVPKLRENFYLPIVIRIPFSDINIDPLFYTRKCIEDEVRKYIRKDFIYPETITLWQFFREANYTGGAVIPVLIFDQFEEYFNFGERNKPHNDAFIKELSDLIENRVPEQLEEADTYETLSAADSQNIFRVVISLREDFLAQLEDISKVIPSLNKVRYRILQLRGQEAFDAVYLPAKYLIDEETAIHVLRKIIPKKVSPEENSKKIISDTQAQNEWKEKDFEPYILSLFCYQVNEKRIAAKQSIISKELINQTKVETILSDYYTSSLKKYWRRYHKNFGPILEKNLISEEGYRLLKPATSNEFKAIPEQAMNDLVNDRIIHRENRNDIGYIEISHDLLAKVVYGKKIANKANKRSFIAIACFILAFIILAVIIFKQHETNYAVKKKYEVAKDSLEKNDSIVTQRTIITDSLLTRLLKGDTSNAKKSGTVYFQVNWNPSHQQVVLCMQALRKLNFTVPDPADVKATNPPRNLIRYFHAEDDINAQLIKSICDHYYTQPFTIQLSNFRANKVPPGQMEVWVVYEHHYQQIFSDTPAIRKSATAYLVNSYKTVDVRKQWPKKMVATARANPSNRNGVYNTLYVFSKMDYDYLNDDRDLIISWLHEVERAYNDPGFKQLIDAIYKNIHPRAAAE